MKVLLVLSLALTAVIAFPILEAETPISDAKVEEVIPDNNAGKIIKGVNEHIPRDGEVQDVATPIFGAEEHVPIGKEITNLEEIPTTLVGANENLPEDLLTPDMKDATTYILGAEEHVPVGLEEDLKDPIKDIVTEIKDDGPFFVYGEESKDMPGKNEEIIKEIETAAMDEDLFMLLASFADPVGDVKPEATR